MLQTFRRLFRGSPVGVHDVKDAAVPEAPRDTRAFHESIFKTGSLPPGAPAPKLAKIRVDGYGTLLENAVANVVIPILAAPGVGVRSFVNKARYGDMGSSGLEVDFAVGPPQYLCDGNVYALGLAKLPLPHFLRSGFAVDSQRMAVIIAYAVDDAASMTAAEELYRRLVQSFLLKMPHSSPLPFPVLLLGMRADLMSHEQVAEGLENHTDSSAANQEARPSMAGFVARNKLLHHYCSAKTGNGMLEAMGSLVEQVDAMAKADLDPESTLEKMRDVWIPTVARIMGFEDVKEPELPAPAAARTPGAGNEG